VNLEVHYMKSKNIYIILGLILTLSIFQGCCDSEEGKIPISTSSCEARDNYLTGKEFANNLQRQEALVYFEKAIEQDPEFALAYLEAGLAQSQTEEIFEYVEKAVSLVDDVSEGEKLIILAWQAAINQDSEKQLEYYKELKEKYPEDEYALYNVGNYYFSQHEFEKAIGYYKRIININKEFAPVYNQLGYAFRYLDKYDDAERSFKKYIKLVPEYANPYDSYGELLLKMGEYEASIEQYTKAIKKDSNFVASYIGLASNLVYISDYFEARLLMERFYNTARNSEAKHRALMFNALTYIDEGDFRNAIKTTEKLINETRRNNNRTATARALGILSSIYFETGKYDKAIKHFTNAINTIQESKLPSEIKHNTRYDILFGEALVHSKKKKFKLALSKAKEYMDEAQKSSDTHKIRTGHEIYGRVAVDMKDYNKAIEELKESDLLNPYNMFLLAKAYLESNDVESAKSYFEKIVKFNSLLELDYALCRNNAKKQLIDLQ